jgi:hypothetical protein
MTADSSVTRRSSPRLRDHPKNPCPYPLPGAIPLSRISSPLNYNCRLLFPFHARIARFNLCRKRSDEPAVSGRSTSSTNYCRYRTSKASEGFADIRHCPLKSFVNSRNRRHGPCKGEDRGVGVAEHMDACVYRKLDSANLVVKATENWV